jgi:hypothetical protein
MLRGVLPAAGARGDTFAGQNLRPVDLIGRFHWRRMVHARPRHGSVNREGTAMSQEPAVRPSLTDLALTAEAIGDRITPDLLMNTALATELRSAAEDMVALMSAPDGPHGRLLESADTLAALLATPTLDAEGLLRARVLALRLCQDVHHAYSFAQRSGKVVNAVAESAIGIVGHTDSIERAVEELQRAVVGAARPAA